MIKKLYETPHSQLWKKILVFMGRHLGAYPMGKLTFTLLPKIGRVHHFSKKKTQTNDLSKEYQRGKYHCTVDLLFN
jgi:hypothetical protein